MHNTKRWADMRSKLRGWTETTARLRQSIKAESGLLNSDAQIGMVEHLTAVESELERILNAYPKLNTHWERKAVEFILAAFLEESLWKNLRYVDMPRGVFTFLSDGLPNSVGAHFLCRAWVSAVNKLLKMDELKETVSIKVMDSDSIVTAVKRVKSEWKSTGCIPAAFSIKVYQGKDWTFF